MARYCKMALTAGVRDDAAKTVCFPGATECQVFRTTQKLSAYAGTLRACVSLFNWHARV